MPEVRKPKSQAKDFCDGGRKGRVRRAKSGPSRFVLIALVALGTYLAGIVGFPVGDFLVANSLPTVKSPAQRLSSESKAAATRRDTAKASMTPCWCQFKRA